MKHILIPFCILMIASCSKKKQIRSEITDFITDSTSIAFRVNHKETFITELRNNDYFNASDNDTHTSPFNLIEHLNTDDDILIAWSAVYTTENNRPFRIITKLKDSILGKDTVTVKKLDSFKFGNNYITKRVIANDTLFMTVVDSFLVASNVKSQLEQTIDIESASSKNLKILPVSDNSSVIQINQLDSVENKHNILGKHIILDMNVSKESLQFRGITTVSDSTYSITSLTSGTMPSINKMANIVPASSKGFISYSFNDLGKIISSQNQINKATRKVDYDTHKDLILEVGSFNIKRRQVHAIRSLDPEIIIQTDVRNLTENYKQIDIMEMNSLSKEIPLLNIFFKGPRPKYQFLIDDFIIFTETIDDARQVISNYLTRSTLSQSELYKKTIQNISDESSILYFSRATELDSVIKANLPNAISNHLIKTSFDREHVQIAQLVHDNGFAHVNFLIQEQRKKTDANSVTEEFSISIDNDLLNDPQVLKNHINGQKDILVQDIENNLYLISNKGKLLWKKKINGPVLGKAEQLDIFKNGRLQLAFATPKRLYVLDRNGKEVQPFPLKFKDEITQPLSVFDYDNTKNYRLMVVQGKNVLMYDSKGKIVRGFTFKSAKDKIISQPKHFRVANKDYIVFAAGKKMHVLNRRGQTRVTTKQNINFSGKGIYLFKGNFTTSNSAGQLVQVDRKGNVSKQDLMLTENHHLATTSKTLVTLVENKLSIRSKTLELDFGDYTSPQIFYLNDKIYVAVTDLQSQKILLFDSQASLIPNFPIYGNSSIMMDNMDKDRNLEIAVKGSSNSVILYQLN